MHRLFLSVSYYLLFSMFSFFFFFFNDTATTEIYTLSLHDALPISRACEIEQRFGFVHIQIPVERLDAAARQAALAAIVGDAVEVARQRREPVHLSERLLAARRGPARDHRAPSARREHQQMRGGFFGRPLNEIIDPDTVDRCEWHGVSCPVSARPPLRWARPALR